MKPSKLRGVVVEHQGITKGKDASTRSRHGKELTKYPTAQAWEKKVSDRKLTTN
jgi:hypothetical protein